MNERIAVMDLGTNTFHLVIADVRDGKSTVVFRDRQPVKLGQGGINQSTIRQDAMERAVACMKSFQREMASHEVTRSVAIGTSALRSAANGREVLDRIRNETNISVDVISGDKEAEYIYLGVREAVPMGTTRSLIVDIGGGSVEFILADQNSIHWKVSLDIGAQRLLETFHRRDPITPEDRQALLDFYAQALMPLKQALASLPTSQLIGSSGTFDTLSEIYCVRQGLPYSPVPETPLTIPVFWEIHEELIAKNREARMRIPGMIEMRVEMIVVASCLIAYIVEQFHINRIRVSSWSLKEGVLAMMTKQL